MTFQSKNIICLDLFLLKNSSVRDNIFVNEVHKL